MSGRGKRAGLSVAMSMACAIALLTGCSVAQPGPAATTAAQKVEEKGKNVADELEELGKIIVDPNLPPRQRYDQLEAKGKQYYCAAENSSVADFFREGLRKLRDQLAAANPEAGIPPFTLDKGSCG